MNSDAGIPFDHTYTSAPATPTDATTSTSGPTLSNAFRHRIMLRSIF